LVDSGADLSCLPYGYAELLGYDDGDLTEYQGTQAQGAMSMYRAAIPIEAQLPGDTRPFELHPSFIANGEMVLWGRLDLFRVFNVSFSETAQNFALIRV
jgi:hypothetical protein